MARPPVHGPHPKSENDGRDHGLIGEQHTESRRKFLQMPLLDAIGVEEDAVIWGEITPRFVEVCLPSTHSLTACDIERDAKQTSADRPGVVANLLNDFRVSEVFQPSGQFYDHPLLSTLLLTEVPLENRTQSWAFTS